MLYKIHNYIKYILTHIYEKSNKISQ